MKTLTLNVDSKVEESFRKKASKKYGGKKGFLGKAVTEAMKLWINTRRQEDITKRQTEFLEKGHDFGGKLYTRREEIHGR